MDEKSDMLAKIIQQFLDKKTDSISISKTSTGKFSYDVKIYNENLLDPEKQDQVIAQIKAIKQKLEAEIITPEGG